MKKFLLPVLMAASIALVIPCANAAGVMALKEAPEKRISAPLLDYSSFIKFKIEKYNDTLQKFFKTVKRNCDEGYKNYQNYKEIMDMIQKDPVMIDRA